MVDPASSEVSRILAAFGRGEPGTAERLLPLVYEELRALAGRHLARERAAQTLQPTLLADEAWMRMAGRERAPRTRAQFFALAAGVIRGLLVDHARAKAASKRGGGWRRVTLDEGVAVTEERDVDVLALHEALARLSELDERQGRIVELRFFAGLSVAEVAEVLAVSTRTVEGEWSMARAWLRQELGGEAER